MFADAHGFPGDVGRVAQTVCSGRCSGPFGGSLEKTMPPQRDAWLKWTLTGVEDQPRSAPAITTVSEGGIRHLPT